MARKPKLFCWSDGFHAFTVAAPSRKAALQAWGFERDRFADGSAREIDGGPDAEAALADPGKVIQRGLAVDVGQSKPAAKPKGPNAAARKKVDALEADLERLDEEAEAALDALRDKRAAVDAEIEAAEAGHRKARKALNAKLKTARDKL